MFFNGLGGFAADGREYVTILGEGQWTPAPWINVIANPSFGFQVSVEGAGYTWSINSRENQITPWSNDPVGDRPGEVIYVRDEDTDELWGPTALPIREDLGAYSVRHGQGYSIFEHTSHGVSLELEQYVPLEDSIKISRLKIRNLSARSRHLSVTAYVEWVLGTSRGASAPFVVTEIDSDTHAMFARNLFSTDYGSRVAFADLGGRQLSWTGDRTEFLGRNGTLDNPAALASAAPLSERVGAGLDPCGALQTRLELKPNGVTEIVFFLGEAATKVEALSLVAKYRTADLDAVFAAVTCHVGRHPRRGSGENPRSFHGYHAEPLAALSDSRLPRVGPIGILPGQRRIRLSRSASGRDGASSIEACHGARPYPACGRAPVRRRRRSALVASAVRSRSPHSGLRRPRMVAVYRRSFSRGHQRSRGSRRDDSFSRWPGSLPRRG